MARRRGAIKYGNPALHSLGTLTFIKSQCFLLLVSSVYVSHETCFGRGASVWAVYNETVSIHNVPGDYEPNKQSARSPSQKNLKGLHPQNDT